MRTEAVMIRRTIGGGLAIQRTRLETAEPSVSEFHVSVPAERLEEGGWTVAPEHAAILRKFVRGQA